MQLIAANIGIISLLQGLAPHIIQSLVVNPKLRHIRLCARLLVLKCRYVLVCFLSKEEVVNLRGRRKNKEFRGVDGVEGI